MLLATLGPFIYIYLQRKAEKFLLSRTSQLQEELQTTQQRLLQAERLAAAGSLASSLAHEIKNPLTSIRTFTSFLEERYKDPEFIKKFTKIVPSELDRIHSILQQLLDFSCPKPLKLSPYNIANLLDETLELVEPQLSKHNICLRKLYTSKDIPPIMLDTHQLKQALLNILLNAIDAMEKGGSLTIALDSKPGQLTITISDTGKGISKQDLAHIFDPFYSKKDKGIGLGLAITYGIIKNHKADIRVKSKPKEGTTFLISFPI